MLTKLCDQFGKPFDVAGVVHHQEQVLIGESWYRGSLILSWDDVERDLQGKQSGRNVVSHEIAHKLDMLNRIREQFPLRCIMAWPVTEWSIALGAAYESLVQRVEHHHRICLNPYAASSPAKFFAVISEYFFSAPEITAQALAIYLFPLSAVRFNDAALIQFP